MIQRNKTLDIYKGILIALVVLRHVLQYSVTDEGGILTNFIWAVQMPGFMLVSGYFSARKILSISEIRKRIASSLQHYALPFLSWFILINVLLLGNYDRNPILGLYTLFNHVDIGLWFLWVVFVLSIFASVLNICISSKSLKIVRFLGSILLFYGLMIVLGKLYGLNFIGIKYILYYSLFYGFGWLVKWTEQWWKKWWSKASNVIVALCFISFLAIVFNYDLYHAGDGLISIVMRLISGFTGNLVIINICCTYEKKLNKLKTSCIGMYTLEIYTTSVYVSALMKASNNNVFFSLPGFGNFIVSLFLTVLFTVMIICVFYSNNIIKRVFYGK